MLSDVEWACDVIGMRKDYTITTLEPKFQLGRDMLHPMTRRGVVMEWWSEFSHGLFRRDSPLHYLERAFTAEVVYKVYALYSWNGLDSLRAAMTSWLTSILVSCPADADFANYLNGVARQQWTTATWNGNNFSCFHAGDQLSQLNPNDWQTFFTDSIVAQFPLPKGMQYLFRATTWPKLRRFVGSKNKLKLAHGIAPREADFSSSDGVYFHKSWIPAVAWAGQKKWEAPCVMIFSMPTDLVHYEANALELPKDGAEWQRVVRAFRCDDREDERNAFEDNYIICGQICANPEEVANGAVARVDAAFKNYIQVCVRTDAHLAKLVFLGVVVLSSRSEAWKSSQVSRVILELPVSSTSSSSSTVLAAHSTFSLSSSSSSSSSAPSVPDPMDCVAFPPLSQ